VLDTAWDTTETPAVFLNTVDSLVAELQDAGRSVAAFTPAPDRVVLVSVSAADSVAADAALSRIANVLGLAG